MFKLIKRINCKHLNQKCLTNIHGDWRLDWNCMSVWNCEDCGKWFYKDILDPDCEYTNFRRLPEEVLKGRKDKENS